MVSERPWLPCYRWVHSNPRNRHRHLENECMRSDRIEVTILCRLLALEVIFKEPGRDVSSINLQPHLHQRFHAPRDICEEWMYEECPRDAERCRPDHKWEALLDLSSRVIAKYPASHDAHRAALEAMGFLPTTVLWASPQTVSLHARPQE